MKNTRFLSVVTLTLAAVLGIGLLAGCSKGATEDAAATETEEQTANVPDESNEQKEADGAADTDANVEPDSSIEDGPVWLAVRRVQTYKSGDEETSIEITYENDDRGNAIKATQSMIDDDPYVTSYEFDEDGILLSMTFGEDDANVVTYTAEKDDQGRLVKLTGSDDTVQEYTYNKNGDIATVLYSATSYGEDMDGNWVETGTFTNVTTYDDEGLPVETVYDGEVKQTTKYTYERDESGKIVKMKSMTEYASEDLEGTEVNEYESDVECDDNGNVVRVEELGEDYSLVTVVEYAEVANPSPWARANAHLKVF